jgi:hypothetical protein
VQAAPELRDWVDAMCCLLAFGPIDQSAATEYFRTYALSGWSAAQMLAALSATKLVHGTRELIESIATQATLADIRLNSPVRRVVQNGEGVRVELTSGDTVDAPAALITLPMNVLNSVEFDPGLSEIKRTASTERDAGAGRKCYVRVKGDIGNVSVLTPESHAVNWAVTYDHDAEGSWLVLAEEIRELSGTTLVCWHHEAIHRIADHLGLVIPDPPHSWPEDRFDLVWTFTRTATDWKFAPAAPARRPA